MSRSFQKWSTFAALFGLAWWFFGNLYEAIVISPNWVVDPEEQVERLHRLFVVTSPTVYFVPVTTVAVVVVWVLTLANADPTVARAYRRASACLVLAMALNAFVVGTLVMPIFAADALGGGVNLAALVRRWNVLNVVRMGLTAAGAAFVLEAFRILDRPAPDAAPSEAPA